MNFLLFIAMEQQKNTNEETGKAKNSTGRETSADNTAKEQNSENTKAGSHDEGQHQEGIEGTGMSPGSSDAEVNPSAKDHLKENS